MEKERQEPKVILAGAGPGEASLITIKAAKFLEKADYILVDRLVNPAIVELYANPKAEVIYVGKQGGKESISQEAINALVVEYGKKDGLTVRLKGGDVAFFSQAIFEIRALNENNIPFEIVPGVTAASGASASLKTPLTVREISRGARILTYHDGEHFTSVEWRNMADTTDTLIFYMSSKSLPELVHNLRQYAYHDKTIAIIEQATTPQERVLISSIFKFENELAATIIIQPALVIIGEVMKLYEGPSQAKEKTVSFFKEV